MVNFLFINIIKRLVI